jgi:glycosyltransferase involved in cell wall biosynthesis
MPKVSVILPTFNRADTILRAIGSVQKQSFGDWELIVIDDGSTDGTADLLAGIDPRIVLLRQANAGMTEARNTGIRAARGHYLAFLDSDDEFLPQHLELCAAFLDAFPDELIVSTELLEDFGHGRVLNHYRVETSQWYPQKAALVGSHSLDLPPGESDDYLRVYDSREPVGVWGSDAIEQLQPGRPAHLYRGRIFGHLRYDYLIAITASMLRASAFTLLGPPEPRWATGSDFHFLARVCQHAPANFIAVPTFVKHEYTAAGKLPANGHIVTGKSSLAFIRDWQAAWEDLFWDPHSADSETRGLRALRHYWMAEVALRAGDRHLALDYLHEARAGLPTLRKAALLERIVRSMPNAMLARKLQRVLERLGAF